MDTNEGMITLHGKVGSAQQRSAAERIAKGISGVKSVRNLLQVVPEAEEERVEQSDERIKEAVQQRLEADATLEDSGLEASRSTRA